MTEHRRIYAGCLLGDDRELARLFMESAAFHAAIETLGELLPAMIDGLAYAARHQRGLDAVALAEAIAGPVDATALRRLLDEDEAERRLSGTWSSAEEADELRRLEEELGGE